MTIAKNKLSSVNATNSSDNENDFYATTQHGPIELLTNILSRMNNQGISGKFQEDKMIVTYTTLINGSIKDATKTDFEVTHKEIKDRIQDTYEDKSGKKLKLKEVGESFDVEPAYDTFKRSLVKYSKFYTYKE